MTSTKLSLSLSLSLSLFPFSWVWLSPAWGCPKILSNANQVQKPLKRGYEPLTCWCRHANFYRQLNINIRMLFHAIPLNETWIKPEAMPRYAVWIARHPAQTARTRIPGSKTTCRSPGAISCNSKGSDFPTPLRAMTWHWTPVVFSFSFKPILPSEHSIAWRGESTIRAPGWTRRLQGWRTVWRWNLLFAWCGSTLCPSVFARLRACVHTNMIRHVRKSSIIVQIGATDWW